MITLSFTNKELFYLHVSADETFKVMLRNT